MIFRAMFWIGLVALLMPHEPDLGLGRPVSVGAPVASEVGEWARAQVQPNMKDPQHLCSYNATACASGATLLDTVASMTARGLADVKADIETSRRAHSQTTRS